ncbi:hypothetical protein AMECASPLE_000672 [Ameca splendens]|uniref:Secreted protein n=1 Tax=Ameca splendens TaxID=208324 RepID=A0ABV1A7B0_9TELE
MWARRSSVAQTHSMMLRSGLCGARPSLPDSHLRKVPNIMFIRTITSHRDVGETGCRWLLVRPSAAVFAADGGVLS